MAGVYSPQQLGIQAPPGGFRQGGWYGGRQYWAGTLSEPGSLHPSSNQQGAGNQVSAEVNAQSARQQGVSTQQFNSYLDKQRQSGSGITPASNIDPSTFPGGSPAVDTGMSFDAGQIQTPSINLPELYKSISQDLGISEKQSELSQKEREFIDAKAKINDNPFLSEATRVGRVAKLETQYQERTANLRGEIAQKQADLETMINLQTRQFEIDSQQAKDALSRFNSLLELGALDNINGDGIAALTRTTGLSSSMIQSAIVANKKKNQQTSTISFDDGVNQGFVIIDPTTGAVINKQVVASSKSANTGGSGGSGGGSSLTTTQKRNATATARKALAEVDTNNDSRLSIDEYKDAVRQVMVATGLDFAEADDFATTAFVDLGYKKWKW